MKKRGFINIQLFAEPSDDADDIEINIVEDTEEESADVVDVTETDDEEEEDESDLEDSEDSDTEDTDGEENDGEESDGKTDGDGDAGDKENKVNSDTANSEVEEKIKKAVEEATKKQNGINAQTFDILKKYGLVNDGETADKLQDVLDRISAEEAGVSVEEYRENRKAKEFYEESKKQKEYELKEKQRELFQKLMTADLNELKSSFPIDKGITDIKDAFDDFEQFKNFGKLRDNGIDVKTAYMAVCGEKVTAMQNEIAKKNTGSKAHLKSNGKASTSSFDKVTMTTKEMQEWRALFPNKSDKEIAKLYKETKI